MQRIIPHLALGVLSVPPSKSSRNLVVSCINRSGASGCQAVSATYHHLSDDALVAVTFLPDDVDRFTEHEVGKILFRALTKRLLLFRSIDSSNPNGVLVQLTIQHLDRVSIGNADYSSGERVSPQGSGRKECCESQAKKFQLITRHYPLLPSAS